MKTVAAADFKARCLGLMEEVRRHRQPLVVTKRGVPIVKLVPAETEPRDIFGCLAGTLRIAGDIESPVVKPREWAALR